jgi:hypothetical protein
MMYLRFIGGALVRRPRLFHLESISLCRTKWAFPPALTCLLSVVNPATRSRLREVGWHALPSLFPKKESEFTAGGSLVVCLSQKYLKQNTDQFRHNARD